MKVRIQVRLFQKHEKISIISKFKNDQFLENFIFSKKSHLRCIISKNFQLKVGVTFDSASYVYSSSYILTTMNT